MFPSRGWVSIDVADDGPGLAPEAREKLFQPFAGSARDGGSGLGLVIVRDIARAHGGEVVLLPEERDGVGGDDGGGAGDVGLGGARFRLRLPARRGEA